jgi:flagellar basal body-associated protein FliL
MAAPEQPKSQDSKKVIIIIVISILLGVNGLLLWQFFDKKTHLEQVSRELDTNMAEKESLSAELQRVKNEYEKLNQENASLQNQLSARDEEIRQKIAQIQKLINSGDAAQLKRAKEEMAALKTLNQSYIVQMDSLREANRLLNDQNLTLSNDLSSANSRVASLNQQNSFLSNKVAIASVLKTTNLKAIGIRFKGSGKESEINKAKTTERIKTCFTILENLVVEKGPKDIYMRVLSPDGAVMSTSSETFTYNGAATLYTTRESIMYENKNTDLCIYWQKGNTYNPGKYTIELYCTGSLIGTTSLELK